MPPHAEIGGHLNGHGRAYDYVTDDEYDQIGRQVVSAMVVKLVAAGCAGVIGFHKTAKQFPGTALRAVSEKPLEHCRKDGPANLFLTMFRDQCLECHRLLRVDRFFPFRIFDLDLW
jgi:hypothetical protein